MCLFFRVTPGCAKRWQGKKPTWCEIFISQLLASLLSSVCKTWYWGSNWSIPTTAAAAEEEHLAGVLPFCHGPFPQQRVLLLKPASLHAKSNEAHPVLPGAGTPAWSPESSRAWAAGQWQSGFSGHPSLDPSPCRLLWGEGGTGCPVLATLQTHRDSNSPFQQFPGQLWLDWKCISYCFGKRWGVQYTYFF